VTKLEPSALVSLYQLDTTRIGGPLYHFTTETRAGNIIRFGGVDFFAVPVRITGMDVSGQGPIQTPTLTVGNTDGFIQEIVNSFGNLEGCRLQRWRTFAIHLDDGEQPNTTAVYGPDVYVIDRKSADTPESIEWELSATIDQQGVFVGRTVVRDTCLWRYREFDPATGQFDYSKALCPYTGNNYFDRQNRPVTNPADDEPSRTIRCCRLRFGTNAVLPFGGFPGVVRGL
jgi:lambda family phage minor tail protein L